MVLFMITPTSLRWFIGTIALLCAFSVPTWAQDSKSRIAKGSMRTFEFASSQIYPGTTRQCSVYVPAEYEASKPAHLLVCMDGQSYAKADGAYRVPLVLDQLIEAKEIPPTIAVFVNPGTVPPTIPGASARSNRSFEYDSLGDRYARFLIDELLPVALKDLHVSQDPAHRIVCGNSSGGICAFTVAWERPDQFGKVVSHIGSYTNIRGGWAYPGLIRKTKDKPKAIQVYLQDGKEDLNNLFGSWPLGNHDMAAALQFAGYRYKLEFTEGGHSGKWAGEKLTDALRWIYNDNAEPTVIPNPETHPEWQPPADAVPRDDVPHGQLVEMPAFESKLLANTTRQWSIYVPAQYKADEPAAVMVFQDGGSFAKPKGRWRVPVVFDNLIARGEMPPTIAIFVDPGHDKSKTMRDNKPSERSLEYDSLGDRYVRFLLEELIPEVDKKYNLSKDPAMRAIGGSSSGGICAFTAAWERPDAFGKVFTSVGSFTNLRGGNVYPSLVRKTEPKPIRVYMVDTSGDIDNQFGSWPWANQLMAAALKYMGYDVRFDWAEGYAHNSDYGSMQFPDAMRWLWRNETFTPQLDTKGDLGGDLTLLKLLIPGEGWQVVAEGLGFADAPCCDTEGNFYYCDMRAPAVMRVDAADGKATKISSESVSGLEFGPDGKLYACQGSKSRVIAIDPVSGNATEIAKDVHPNDLAVSKNCHVYITETKERQVRRIDPKSGETAVVASDINLPNGIALSNDGGTLAVSEYGGEHVWMFRVNADGSLDAGMTSMTLRKAIDPKGKFEFHQAPPYMATAKGDGMAVDAIGRYYVTSDCGVQIFDPTGRLSGVLPAPMKGQPLTSCVLAGANRDELYITNGNTILKRKLQIK